LREKHEKQRSLVVPAVEDPIAKELVGIRAILDDNPTAVDLVAQDLVAGGTSALVGRPGMSAERVLRALVLKKVRGLTYDELEFHLKDSRTFRWFVGFGLDEPPPSGSTLQANIARIQPATLQKINETLCLWARRCGVEDGQRIRTDCTVVESNIHYPSDSSLLLDVVTTAVRLMGAAVLLMPGLEFSDHTRAAKRRAMEINYARRKEKRQKPYRQLVRLTKRTLEYAADAHKALDGTIPGLEVQLGVLLDLGQRVINQTERRVFQGESVPAEEKIVSIFEPHTDIIIKDYRNVFYGHKVCLSSGRSGLITDCEVESGNPADSNLVERTLGRHVDLYGRAPEQFTCDGGFASRANLEFAKELGVVDVCFTKGRGMTVDEMVSSHRVYRELRRFRAGVESGIAYLKKAFGWVRCDWRGWEAFQRYVHSSVLACNLMILARQLTDTG